MTDAEDRAMIELSCLTPCDGAVNSYELVKMGHDPARAENRQVQALAFECQESRRMMQRTLARLEDESEAASRMMRETRSAAFKQALIIFESEYNAMAAEISRRVEAGE